MGGLSFTITFSITPSERSLPFPIFLHGMFCFLYLFIHRPSIYSLPYPLRHSISPRVNTLPVFSHLLKLHVYLRFPIPPLSSPAIPCTALRSEYPLKFKKWNFQQEKHVLKPFQYLRLRHTSLHPKAGGCYQFDSHYKILGLQIVTQNLSISDFTKLSIRLLNRVGVVFQTL